VRIKNNKGINKVKNPVELDRIWIMNEFGVGGLDKTVSVDMDKVIVKPPIMIYEHKSKPESE